MYKLNEKNLTHVLMVLRSESRRLNLNATEENLKSLMHKYNMLFVGKNFNTIYSQELLNVLKTHFSIDAVHDELNALLPTVCECLNMACEPLVIVENIGKNVVDYYSISL